MKDSEQSQQQGSTAGLCVSTSAPRNYRGSRITGYKCGEVCSRGTPSQNSSTWSVIFIALSDKILSTKIFCHQKKL